MMMQNCVYVVFESDAGGLGALEGCSTTIEGALAIAREANNSILFLHNEQLADVDNIEELIDEKISGECIYLEDQDGVGFYLFKSEIDKCNLTS